MKNSISVPADNSKFIETLCDDQSYFCFKLEESLSAPDNAWCTTCAISKQSKLPSGCLPSNHIIAFLMLDYPVVNHFANLL